MKRTKYIQYLILILTALALNSCAMHPTEDEFALDTPAKIVPQTQLKAELATIDSQISKLNSQIDNAQNRLKTYKTKKIENNMGLIMSTQAEIQNFEIQKSNLSSRKLELSSDLVIE